MKPAAPPLGTSDFRLSCPADAGTMAPSAASPPIKPPGHRDVITAMCPLPDVSSLGAIPETALTPGIDIIEVPVARYTVDLIDIATDALGRSLCRADIAYWKGVVIADDARQPDFRLLLAVTNGGHSVGFAYGYCGRPDNTGMSVSRTKCQLPFAAGGCNLSTTWWPSFTFDGNISATAWVLRCWACCLRGSPTSRHCWALTSPMSPQGSSTHGARGAWLPCQSTIRPSWRRNCDRVALARGMRRSAWMLGVDPTRRARRWGQGCCESRGRSGRRTACSVGCSCGRERCWSGSWGSPMECRNLRDLAYEGGINGSRRHMVWAEATP